MVERAPSIAVAILVGVALTVASALAQQRGPSAARSKVVTQGSAQETAVSQLKAKEIYGYDCSMCHGTTGNGKTSLTAQPGWNVPDLTDPATLAGKSDRELDDIIWKGKGKMPGEKGRASSDEAQNLVTYIRELSNRNETTEHTPWSARDCCRLTLNAVPRARSKRGSPV
jgi:cytochrome c5